MYSYILGRTKATIKHKTNQMKSLLEYKQKREPLHFLLLKISDKKVYIMYYL